jgi:hypothetical protein
MNKVFFPTGILMSELFGGFMSVDRSTGPEQSVETR